MTDPLAASSLARIEAWLRDHRRNVLLVVIVLAALVRGVVFLELYRGPVLHSHVYGQMDMRFFSRWAEEIAWEDALVKEPMHPMHVWHTLVAAAHYDRHPEILGKSFVELGEPEREKAAKKIWDEWYGGNRFHQEPLYPYLVALLYKVWGATEPRLVYVVQMLGGVLTVALLFLLTVRFFGDLVGVLAAGMAMLWGPLIHYEVMLLRTSFISLAGIALLYCGQRLIDGRDSTGGRHITALLAFGCLVGVATTLKTTLLVFAAGLLVVLFWPLRRQVRTLLVQGGAVLAGILVILAPFWIRNYLVGAPFFSLTSVGAVTFAGTNVPGFIPSFGWFPYEYPHLLAQVMEEGKGSLLGAIGSAIAMHESLRDYIALLLQKFALIWHWCELPNNTNYYYTCVHSSVMAASGHVVNALLILPAGIVGIAISLSQRRRIGTLLWYLVCCLVPLVVFYVLSRLRAPLVVGMMPFAAFAIVQIIDRLLANRFKSVAAPLVALVVLVAVMARPLDPPRPILASGPYLLAMNHYYLPRIGRLGGVGDHAAAVREFQAILATRPAFVDQLGSTRSIQSKEEAVLVREVFRSAYKMGSEAADAAGQDLLARHFREEAARLEAAVEQYYRAHPEER